MRRDMDRPHTAVFVRTPVLAWGAQPVRMGRLDVLGHHRRREDVVLKGIVGSWLWDATEDPEKVFLVWLLGLLTNGTGRAAPRHIGFDLDVNELRAFDIAAEDVRVGGIAKGHHRIEAAATQLSSDEKLAGISPKGLIGGHQKSE